MPETWGRDKGNGRFTDLVLSEDEQSFVLAAGRGIVHVELATGKELATAGGVGESIAWILGTTYICGSQRRITSLADRRFSQSLPDVKGLRPSGVFVNRDGSEIVIVGGNPDSFCRWRAN